MRHQAGTTWTCLPHRTLGSLFAFLLLFSASSANAGAWLQEPGHGIAIAQFAMSESDRVSDINGNPNDVLVGNYNGRKNYLDGDFGAAYTSRGFNIQGSIPNLKSFFKKDEIKQADVATFYGAVSYRIGLSEGIDAVELEPKVAYRGVKGYDNIWDAGTQVAFADRQVFVMGMYHSSENATFGLGMDFRKKYLISGMYTTQTSALSGYTNGSFELSLRLNLSK